MLGQGLLELPCCQQDQLFGRVFDLIDSKTLKVTVVLVINLWRVVVFEQAEECVREPLNLLGYSSCPDPVHAITPARAETSVTRLL